MIFDKKLKFSSIFFIQKSIFSSIMASKQKSKCFLNYRPWPNFFLKITHYGPLIKSIFSHLLQPLTKKSNFFIHYAPWQKSTNISSTMCPLQKTTNIFNSTKILMKKSLNKVWHEVLVKFNNISKFRDLRDWLPL